MKKICILLIALLMVRGVMAQNAQPCSTCLPEGITFETQAQIDSFQINYPDCLEIEGDVTIEGSDITNLNGLNVLTSIGGGLEVDSNDVLIGLTGLENLTSIGDYLSISVNASLTSLTGLENLASIGGGLFIYYNDALTSLTELENLTSIGDGLEIDYNASLTSLTGLDNLISTERGLFISYNDALTSLTELENLTSIGDDIWIGYNDALTSLTGLENLTSIGGGIWIGFNDALISLTGLDNLTSIGGFLLIKDNDALTSLTELENLTSIGEWISISYNTSLTSLTGLDNLTSIGGFLSIKDNDSLTSLTGLDNIAAGSISDLYIINNDYLSNCAIQSICNYLASPNGIVEIHDNSTGCNSPEEVHLACTFGLDESNLSENQFSIFPNPTFSTITLSTPTTPYLNTFLTIYNVNGKELIKRKITEQQTEVDVAGLGQGVYFVRVVNDEGVMVGKFMKY